MASNPLRRIAVRDSPRTGRIAGVAIVYRLVALRSGGSIVDGPVVRGALLEEAQGRGIHALCPL